jgi:hypothetical protein
MGAKFTTLSDPSCTNLVLDSTNLESMDSIRIFSASHGFVEKTRLQSFVVSI